MAEKNVRSSIQCTMVARFKENSSVKDVLSVTYNLVDSRYSNITITGRELYGKILAGELECVNVGIDESKNTIFGTNGALDSYPLFIGNENRWDDSTAKGVVLNRVEENGAVVEFTVFYPSINRLQNVKAENAVAEYNKYKFANAMPSGTKGGTIRAKKGSFPIRVVSIENVASKKNALKDGIKLSLGQVVAVQKGMKGKTPHTCGVYVFIQVLNNAALAKIRDSFVEQADTTLKKTVEYSGDDSLKETYSFTVFTSANGCTLVGLIPVSYMCKLLVRLGSYNLPLGKLWIDAMINCVDGDTYRGTKNVIYDKAKELLVLADGFEGMTECEDFAEKISNAIIAEVSKTGAKLAA